MDEPDSRYAYIAKSVTVAGNRLSVTFDIDPNAVFSDRTPITASDVVFSFNTLMKDGHPRYRVILNNVKKAKAIGNRAVQFSFKIPANRDFYSFSYVIFRSYPRSFIPRFLSIDIPYTSCRVGPL